MARGKVVSRKRYVYGNLIGRDNANPILDSRRYKVEFDDGEVTELTAKIIAERMYDQCDKNGNDIPSLNTVIKNGRCLCKIRR